MASNKEFLEGCPSETVLRRYLIGGERASVALRIPESLRDAAKDLRACMIEELAKRGA